MLEAPSQQSRLRSRKTTSHNTQPNRGYNRADKPHYDPVYEHQGKSGSQVYFDKYLWRITINPLENLHFKNN